MPERYDGGATKLHGAALYRLRPRDFEPGPSGRTVTDVVALSKEPNDTVFQETLGLNDCGMAGHHVLDKSCYMSMDIPVAGVAHQAGTCRFGADPALTAMANAIRVGEHLNERMQ